MKSIGGYFELEFREGVQYHETALKLSTARQCLEYVLRAKCYNKIYVPFYTCDAILEPILKLGISYEFYHIDKDFEPVFDRAIEEDEVFLYTNYWGLKQKTAELLARRFRNLIVDNSQAFFAKPIDGADTFYSARKFLGVPDGAYLYTNCFPIPMTDYPLFDPQSHISYLTGRLTHSAEQHYSEFTACEAEFSNLDIHRMSLLSDRILRSLDYNRIAKSRRSNYRCLHEALQATNELKIDMDDTRDVPMCYPFLSRRPELRQRLIEQRIYVPRFWRNVTDWLNGELAFEHELACDLCPLPVDQRYDETDMQSNSECINK